MGRSKSPEGRAMIRSFSYPMGFDPVVIELENIANREHLSFSEIIQKTILEYSKNHGSGNNQFKLEQWLDPGMMAYPAFAGDQQKWNSYLKKCGNKELLDIMRISNLINSKAVRIHHHGKDCDLNQIL